MCILESNHLCKIYGSGESEIHACDDVSLSVEDGEFIAIIGTSGSGKSTLLNLLGGLDRPTSGTVTISGKDLFSMSDEELTIFRRRNIGFVFQNYNLVPILNVYENVVLPIELDGSEIDQKYVDHIIHTLGLESKLTAMPNQLSGGQQQRVAIARALAAKPAIILADEPTGNLDSRNTAEWKWVRPYVKKYESGCRSKIECQVSAPEPGQKYLCHPGDYFDDLYVHYRIQYWIQPG